MKSTFNRIRWLRTLPLLSLAASLPLAPVACAWSPRKAGFDDVKMMAKERIGQEIHWNQDGKDDNALREMVQSRLGDELTAESSVQIALLNNRRLQSVYQSLGIEQAEVVRAGLFPNPVLDGNYKRSINGGTGPEIELAVVESFVGVLALPLRRRIAADKFESAKFRVTEEVLALASEVRGQFHHVQANEQIIEMLQQVVEAMVASVDAARRLHDAGNSRDLDLDNEAELLVQAKLDLTKAEVTARKSRERLNILLGLWGADAAVKVAMRLPDVPGEELNGEDIEKRAVEKNLDLAAQRHRILALGRTLGLTRATALFPDIGLGGGFKRETDGNHLAGPVFSIPLPFFDQGQPRVAAAKAQLRRAQDEFYFKAVETRAAARASWDHLQLARAQALYSRDVALPLQHRILNETQLEYNAMQIGVFQLLQAKRSEIEAGKRYIEDLRDYWLARTEMESLLAGHVRACPKTLFMPPRPDFWEDSCDFFPPERGGEA